MSKLVQKHSYSDLPKYSKISIIGSFGTSDRIIFICIQLLQKLNDKAGYTATLVACGWAEAVLEMVIRASGQEPYAQKLKNADKVKQVAQGQYVVSDTRCPALSNWREGKQGSGPEGDEVM